MIWSFYNYTYIKMSIIQQNMILFANLKISQTSKKSVATLKLCEETALGLLFAEHTQYL